MSDRSNTRRGAGWAIRKVSLHYAVALSRAYEPAIRHRKNHQATFLAPPYPTAVSVTARALWYIETHLRGDLSLDAVASAAGVSRFHVSRAFSVSMGLPLASYARARRLTLAAHQLAEGAPDILSVALDAGYGSHEAFTRAFSQQFGLSPEQVRDRADTAGLALQEAVRLNPDRRLPLERPRVEQGRTLRLVGLADRHDGSITRLPEQWSHFSPLVGHIDGQVGRVAYGVSYNHDESGAFDYLCGVEVTAFVGHPQDFARLTILPQTYAVFTHPEHLSSISHTVGAVLNHALAEAGYLPAEGPFFERYGEAFDPRTGLGGIELWFPVLPPDSGAATGKTT